MTGALNRAGCALAAAMALAAPAHAQNTGSATMKLTGVYVVDKGKPLATPVE